MKIKYGVNDSYLVNNDCKEPPASYSNYKYEARKVSEKEAQQWRDIYRKLYAKGSKYILGLNTERMIRYIHTTNLIMFCGVKLQDTFLVSKYGIEDMMPYKCFDLDRGDPLKLQDILMDAPISKLAEVLSTMHGKQTIVQHELISNDKAIVFSFECEETKEDTNENK